jgi:hypothetical protein
MPTPNYPNDGIPTLGGIPFYGIPYAGNPGHRGHRRGGSGGFTFGNIFFVSSTHPLRANDPANGRRPDLPFATMHYADTQCTASNGDHVYVLPGHTETVTAAAGLDLNTAGVTWRSMGVGPSRATIRFTTATTADMNLDGAGITLQNFLFVGVVDALVAPIDVNAADCALMDCEFRDTSATQAVLAVLTDATADRFYVDGWTHRGDTAAGSGASIAIVGGDGIVLRNLDIVGDFSVGAIDIRTTATTNFRLESFNIHNLNTVDMGLIDTVTGSTGFIMGPGNILIAENTTNITEAITGATFAYFGANATAGLASSPSIGVCNLLGEGAICLNKVGSTDA